MKKTFLFFALLAIATMATAQIKVASNGHVGIGTNNPCWECKLTVSNNGNDVTFIPNKNEANIGSSKGTIDFWHNVAKWNKVGFKSYSLHSDSTAKTNITPLKNATAILKQIKTYSYYFKSDSIYFKGDSIDLRKREYGVLAQEIEPILPDLVDTAKGSMLVNYNAFIAILIKGFNEQQVIIETQQKEINTLQKIVASQEFDLVNLQSLWSAFKDLDEIIYTCCEKPKSMSMPVLPEEPLPVGETAILYQNAPNPFNSNTEISCYLPETDTPATIFIYDLQGAELKSYPITKTGLNSITIYGSELPAGMYLYILVVDNEIIDTKRMILTK